MKHKNISAVFMYLGRVLKKYSQNQNKYNTIFYRVIKIKQDKQHKIKLVVQVAGKTTLFEISPNEVAVDDDMLEGFSKRDVRTITYLANVQDNALPEYELTEQDFSTIENQVLYKLKQKISHKVIIKSAIQIMLDKQLIQRLKPEDAFNIGYIAGTEGVVKEKTLINSVSKASQEN